MKAEEKALEIVEKFKLVKREHIYQDELNTYESIQCALICVDECIDTLDVNIMDFEKCFHAIKFWQEVKQHLIEMKN